MYGTLWDGVVWGLFAGTILTIRQRSETPFVHGRTETSNTRTQTVELDPGCPGPLTSRYHFLKSLPTFIFMLNVVRHSSFIKEWALGGLGFIFGKSCQVGYRYWAKGSRPLAVRVAKKVSPCHLWCRHDHEAKLSFGTLGQLSRLGKMVLNE